MVLTVLNLAFIYMVTLTVLNLAPIYDIILNLALIVESVDSISRDEQDAPLTQYITNARITRATYTIMHLKNHHHVLWLISNGMSV